MLMRLKKEVSMLENDPPFGISAWLKDENNLYLFEANLQGPDDTPYEKGIFKLEIKIPDRYPMSPPKVKFITPIYHPNIDKGGRICLDTLKMPPAGIWAPSLNISTVLTTVQLLLSQPNADDGLDISICHEFKHNPQKFKSKASKWTQQYAMQDQTTTFKELKETQEEENENKKETETEKEKEKEKIKKKSEVEEIVQKENTKQKQEIKQKREIICVSSSEESDSEEDLQPKSKKQKL